MNENKQIKNWTVYLLKCSDDTLYCGCTNNLEKRISYHNSGKGSKYICGRTPVELVTYKSNLTKSEAFQLEYQIKKLPKNKKVDFINSK